MQSCQRAALMHIYKTNKTQVLQKLQLRGMEMLRWILMLASACLLLLWSSGCDKADGQAQTTEHHEGDGHDHSEGEHFDGDGHDHGEGADAHAEAEAEGEEGHDHEEGE